MEERSLHIVIVGHVDHGKSTLIGRLFFETGSLPEEKVAEIRKVSEDLGREVEFAYVMDHLEEERTKGITIDIAHTFFKTDKRRYVIIDAPGHKEFLKNMISGSSQAEAAILLVDAGQGVREQTRRHCFILGLLGIKQVAVVVNKMDLVDYSRDRYEEVRDEVAGVLDGLGITPAFCIPVSAARGENITKRPEALSWFDGPPVLEALDSFNPLVVESKDLRFPVQDVYEVDGQPVAVGRVEAGVLRKGDEVTVHPEGVRANVVEIKKFLEDGIEESAAGECVGVRVDGAGVKRGDVFTGTTSPEVTKTIVANIFWLIEKPYELGLPVFWRCATQESPARIKRIIKRFDPASIEIIEKDSTVINPAEVAEVEIELAEPAAVDRFSEIPELGRFVLEHAGHTVAGGIIT